MRFLIKYSVIAPTIILVDQLTKWLVRDRFVVGETVPVINGFFSFTYVRNPGVAFGFMANWPEEIRRPILLLIPVVAAIALCYLVWKEKDQNKLLSYSYTLIIAGAIGNLIDRYFLGYVVDFADFYYENWHYPAFNVADSAISIAAVMLVVDFIFEAKKKKEV